MNIKNSRRTIVRLGAIACLLLALSGTTGISTAADSVLYVKPSATGTGDCGSWANTCTLQTALGAAGAGDEIWVAVGTHKPTGGTDRAATFQLKNDVALYGGFAGTETSRDQRDWETNPTILSGDIGAVGNNSDNSYHVVTGSGTDATAVLDGFTISDGNANGAAPFNDRGGGMVNNDGKPTLANLTFSNNSAGSQGGGVFNSNSNPTLDAVTFSGNSAGRRGGGMANWNNSNASLTNVRFNGNIAGWGGGMNNSSSNPTLDTVTFSGNSANHGGGMESSGSDPTLVNVTFSGNSANVDGGGMRNWKDSNPTLTNVTFDGNTAADYGGGMRNYDSNPTLTNVTFSGNWGFYGGGVYNEHSSSPMLTNVTFSGNSAGINGGGIFNDDGAVTLTNSDVSDNQARGAETHEGGGGIFNDRGTVELIDSTVSGNSASIEGSGIFNDDGALTLTDSTVSGNSGAKDGGGIYNNTGTVELINSTISGNSVGTDGGGICNAFGGTVTLTNSTISDNEAWYGGGIYNGGLGVVELANTIVAANPRGGDCCSGGTCSGPGIISLGHNLDSDGTCNLNPALGDLPNRDPRLGPLADNGGRTWTHALLPGSPAIDAGDDSACPATDQRGVIRPLDGDADGTATCDIGAYEFEPPTIVVPIDIKPGSDPNSINCNNKNGVIPVAILTTEDFEARTVDHTTLTFEGASEMHVDKKSGEPRRHEEDVDGDGDIDLVFHFRLGDTGLTCDSTEGTLTGETFDSRVIVGSDAVRMIDRGGGKP